MNEQLLKRVEELESWKKSLENPDTIPLEFDRSVRYRFFRNIPDLSSKGASSESVSVNESGSGNYSVLGPPDGFLKVTINSTDYFIPYYG